VRHFEVLNAAIGGANYGDAMHISHEALWDKILSKGILLYGTATDDTHHYYDADALRKQGKGAIVGNRAWIMVLASECSEKAIRAAMEKGEYYCSSGVSLKKYEVTDNEITVEVEPEKPMKYTIEFIGQDGKVLQTDKKISATYKITGKEKYLRVRITDTQKRVALTQPFFIKGEEDAKKSEEPKEKDAPASKEDKAKPADQKDKGKKEVSSVKKITEDQAVKLVAALPEVKSWSKAVRKNKNKPVFESDEMDGDFNGKKYWSITFYEDLDTHRTRFMDFMVSFDGRNILVQDKLDGSYISLKKWRAQEKKNS
jgi:hypothetical protein